MTPRRRAPLPLLAALLTLALTAGVPGCTASEVVATSPERLTGDTDLLAEIEAVFPDDFDRAAVAVVNGDEVRTAFVDADESTVFEIGSITKAFTGELLAIAIEQGEVALDDALGVHLDLGDAPVASVTLRQLATHHAGIPLFTSDPEWVAAFDRAIAAGESPANANFDDLLVLARGLEVHMGAEFECSNIGAALLGHALAAAADTTYSELLTARILEPLGIEDAVLVETPEQVPEAHAGGFTETGNPVEPWSLDAFSPAGGLHATLADLVALVRAVVDGDLADSAALEPIAETDDRDWRIGYHWFIVEDRPRTITLHEGQTGGFTASLLIDRDTRTAAIVLSNSIGDRYPVALRLLAGADR